MTHDLTALACPFCGSVAKWTRQQESYLYENGVEFRPPTTTSKGGA